MLPSLLPNGLSTVETKARRFDHPSRDPCLIAGLALLALASARAHPMAGGARGAKTVAYDRVNRRRQYENLRKLKILLVDGAVDFGRPLRTFFPRPLIIFLANSADEQG